MAKLLAALLAFTLIAAACGGDDDGDAGTDAGGDSDGGSESSDDDAAEDDGGEGESVAPTITEPEPEEEVETGPVRGGVLRVATEADGDGLNPVANNFAVSAYLMAFPMFDPLFAFDSEGNWFPYLAESAAPVEGTNSWQVTLREGVTYHDGTVMTADDVIAAFEATLADPLISLAVAPSYPAENRIEKIDDLTVQYNLLRESAHFPVNLTSQLGMIPPASWIAAAADDPTLDQMPVGQGPFQIVSRTQDDKTVLERFDGYWQGTDDIYLDGIEFSPITDPAIAAERVSAGDLDIQITSTPDAILTLRDDDSVNTVENLFSGENDIMMNTRAAPFDDIRARQALTFAADRDSYAALITQGTSPMADSMFHPDLIWNNPDVVQEGNTPELAGPLVEAYCADVPDSCTDGKINMELQYSGPSVSQTRIADILTAGWEPYFNVTEQELLQDAHILEVATGAFQVVTWRQFGAVDPDNEVVWLECATAEGFITLNWVRWCNPDRDALLYEQRATDDLDRRVEIWREIQQEMNESYAYIFTTHANWTVGYGDRVNNICGQMGPNGETMFCNNQGRQFFHNIWLSEG
ncbi:MAG: ABC transporter substrate-binding protein [Actinomycetota bacterium]